MGVDRSTNSNKEILKIGYILVFKVISNGNYFIITLLVYPFVYPLGRVQFLYN